MTKVYLYLKNCLIGSDDEIITDYYLSLRILHSILTELTFPKSMGEMS
jgi:hypothetical protein